MADERTVTPSTPSGSVPAVIREARKRFDRCTEAEDAQRKSILQAKKFRAGDQWEPALKLAREGGQSLQGVAQQPARPCLVVDRLSPAVRQVSNQARAANFAVDVLPNGHGSDDETARIFKGIIRRIQNHARDDEPIEWAADSAAESGLGWFRITTEYVQVPEDYTGPMLFDQDVKLARISNSLTVYCDPDAKRPTKSDARFMFVTEDLAKEEYKRLYGKTEADCKPLDDLMAVGDQKGWVTQDTVRIAEYWRVEYESRSVYELTNGEMTDQKPDDVKQIKRERTIARPVVKGSKINAVEELESWAWAGSRIPLIPILGEELNVDGKSIVRGIIQPAMDAQRMVNFSYSGAMETFALKPKAPILIAEGQLEGYQAIWQSANTVNYAYLPYKPYALAGAQVPPPQYLTAEAPIEAAVALMAKSEDCVKATTQIYDPGLGNTNPKERSGKAILALQQQSDLGNSNYLDNVTRAIVYLGQLLVELIPKIYDRPGRIVQILGIDDAPEQVMLGQPFVMQGNTPQPAVHPRTGAPLTADDAKVVQGLHKFYDLTEGQYAVTVDVGKQYSTKRREDAAILGDMMTRNPELLQVGGDLFFSDIGQQEMADRIKKAVLLPQLRADDQGQQPLPPQVQAQLQQSQKVIQELTAHVEQLTQVVNTKQVEQKGKLDVENVHADLQLTLQAMKNAAQIEAARIAAAKSALDQNAAALEERIALLHTSVENALDRTHDVNMAQLQAQQGAAQSAQDAQQSADLSAQEHGQALEQGDQSIAGALAQQAAQPQPTNGAGA